MLHLFYTESSQKIKSYLRKVKIRAAAGLPDAIQSFLPFVHQTAPDCFTLVTVCYNLLECYK